jgi:hypothetical protein
MKTQISKLFILAIVSALFVTTANAQDITKKDESRKKKEKELQKKELDSIAEQSKAEYEFELQRLLEEQSKLMDEQESAVEEMEKLSELGEMNVIPYRDLDFKIAIPDVPNAPFFQFDGQFNSRHMSGDNTSFNVSKRLRDATTFNGDFEFTIPENCKSILINFSGSLESGNLKITFSKPDKKVYQEFKVNPVADVRWSKRLKEEDMKDYVGTWKITIAAQDAKGNYNINISTF